MNNSQSFAFTEIQNDRGYADAVPQLPLTLSLQNSVRISALMDTGASINVLPYSVGTELGAVWDDTSASIGLRGGIASVEAKGLIVIAEIGIFDPVRLVFAWSRSDEVPLILGRTSFFMVFDVCFYRSQLFFEVRPTGRD
ncbi:hypothetical protein LEP3755_39240 [Leptolyngbya sp. NIES-3755]|nr:hypothetical protein LEP3755_39240 [Leptolyngbya sp. NIES-3755]